MLQQSEFVLENLSDAQQRFFNPELFLADDLSAIYERGEIEVGWTEGVVQLFTAMARENTVIFIGAQYGDEGKGRIVDNEIEGMLNKVRTINVIRFQGGSNAGHTIYSPKGKKIALHQVPSGIMYEQTMGIMDTGMIIHLEDLLTEIEEAEAMEEVGDLRGKLLLSRDAMLATDIERAREVLNREISERKSAGGTGRGIAPSVAGKIDRTGQSVKDLIENDNWREIFAKKYNDNEKLFAAYGKSIADMSVPDFANTNKSGKNTTRTVGSKQEFLDRLEATRERIILRHNQSIANHNIGFVVNTFQYHGDIYQDLKQGMLGEGAQAVGLDRDYGRSPDNTATNTTAFGLQEGTRFPFYQPMFIKDRIGVFKAYMSSVGGDQRMVTDSGLERRVYSEEEISLIDNKHLARAAWQRNIGREFGASTGRVRDICHLDLELIRYNAFAGSIEMLAATHIDMAREDFPILVCSHYVDESGRRVPYQPGLEYQKNVKPVYVELPGWDGEAAAKATCFDELPDNAKKYLAFVQRNTGIPIVMATNGPHRESLIKFNRPQ